MMIGARLLTVEDLATCAENGDRYEVIDGQLYVSYAPHVEHQTILDEATFALKG